MGGTAKWTGRADSLRHWNGCKQASNTFKELAILGIHEYRELYFKPYRVIYREQASDVYVYLIVDGRRNMQSLLQRRLMLG